MRRGTTLCAASKATRICLRIPEAVVVRPGGLLKITPGFPKALAAARAARDAQPSFPSDAADDLETLGLELLLRHHTDIEQLPRLVDALAS